MKVRYSGLFHYKPSPLSPKVPVGICDVDIVEYDNKVCCAMITERKDNPGVSVTTVCDRIATELYSDFLADVPAGTVVWLEHYPASRGDRAHVDMVQFQLAAGAASFAHPHWLRLFEAKRIVPLEFMESYGNVLKELLGASLVFTVEDKDGYFWRVWANESGLVVLSSNPGAALPDRQLEANEVAQLLRENQKVLRSDAAVEEQFTTALMKGFLNRGL